MKKLLFVLVALLIIPFHVKAIEANFDEDSCILTVSGEEAGHEAQVTLYAGEQLVGFKTSSIIDGNFERTFRLRFEEDTTINITVADENGQNAVTLENVLVPACESSNLLEGKVLEIFDGDGNSLAMVEDTVGFDADDYLVLGMIDEETIDNMIAGSEGEEKEKLIALRDGLLAKLGDYKQFLFVLETVVFNSDDEEKYLGDYEDGYVLNILMPKEVFEAFKGLKISFLDEDLNVSDPLDYDYDEENEVLVINLDYLETLVFYIDNEYEFLDGTGNQTYNLDEDDTVTLKVDANYAKFKAVAFDEEIMDLNTYESGSGSTIVTIKRSYLKNVSIGSHTITVLFADGSATATLNVVNNEPNPGTGDNLIYYIGAFILSMIGLCGAVIIGKKKLS